MTPRKKQIPSILAIASVMPHIPCMSEKAASILGQKSSHCAQSALREEMARSRNMSAEQRMRAALELAARLKGLGLEKPRSTN